MNVSDTLEPGLAPRPREQSRQATRKRLLLSGRRLFATRGLHEVTSHDIARGAGVASGTFYLHFVDKQELFRELVYELLAALQSRLERATSDAYDARAAVIAHTEALVSFAEAHSDLVAIVFGRGHSHGELEREVLDYLASVGARLLEKGIAEGTVSQTLVPAIASQALSGMFVRVLVWWIEDPTRASRNAILKSLVDLQLEGTIPR